MRKFSSWVLLLLLLVGCRYQFQSPDQVSQETISVSPIQGDEMGRLNAAMVHALSQDPRFEYRQQSGVLNLSLIIVDDDDERIGYRYDRSPSTGKRRKNIVGVENRRELVVEVRLTDSRTGEVLLGPTRVKGRADYDYIDPNSVRDLTFTGGSGAPETVINFSLGQLDSVEGAHDDAAVAIYDQLARMIVDGLSVCLTTGFSDG